MSSPITTSTQPTILPNSAPIDIKATAQYAVPYLLAFFVISVSIGLYILIELTANISDIGNNWDQYRCKPHIMPLAGILGHDINENFQFCIQQIVQESTKGTTAPFAAGMSGFTGILGNLMKSANSFRTTLATLTGGIIKIIGEFKSRMTALMGRVKLTVSRMKAMMYRIYGTMFAVMYMGISAQTGIANFGDTFIFKFIDEFCFESNTKIIMDNMTEQCIRDIKVGDILYKGAVVEAVIECPGSYIPLYELKGIYVSGIHKVWSDAENKYICVKDHPDATISSYAVDNTWTLITSTREIPVYGRGGYMRFADWEELPPTKEANTEWNAIANKFLNNNEITPSVPSIPPCIDDKALVYRYQGGLVAISEVKTGDWIHHSKSWTQVIGLCSRQVDGYIPYGDTRITDGLWINLDGRWIHPRGEIRKDKWLGKQLITTSGAFSIYIDNQEYVVRDFTEVGYRNLIESYELEDAI